MYTFLQCVNTSHMTTVTLNLVTCTPYNKIWNKILQELRYCLHFTRYAVILVNIIVHQKSYHKYNCTPSVRQNLYPYTGHVWCTSFTFQTGDFVKIKRLFNARTIWADQLAHKRRVQNTTIAIHSPLNGLKACAFEAKQFVLLSIGVLLRWVLTARFWFTRKVIAGHTQGTIS